MHIATDPQQVGKVAGSTVERSFGLWKTAPDPQGEGAEGSLCQTAGEVSRLSGWFKHFLKPILNNTFLMTGETLVRLIWRDAGWSGGRYVSWWCTEPFRPAA